MKGLQRCLARTGRSGGGRGFTLVEMLVVIAITAILLFLVLAPLTQTFNLTARGQALVAGQDNIRQGMTRFARDMANAMQVHIRPINVWHYDPYDMRFDTPEPLPTAVPARYLVEGACVDLVMPKQRYFCTLFDHHLLESEIPPLAAIDSCPRHPGSPVELRPIEPLRPEPVWVRYFIGLKQPGYPENPPPGNETPPGRPGNLLPHYLNGSLFRASQGSFDNLYVLYRVEFDPQAFSSPTANWRLDATQPIDPVTGSGTPLTNLNNPWVANPNFFYDRDFRAAWKTRSVAVTQTEGADAIRFIREAATWRPEPVIRFVATPIQDDSPQPNRPVARVGANPQDPTRSPQLQPSSIAPVGYFAGYGHWLGLENNLTLPVTPGLILGNSPPAVTSPNYRYGPQIRVYVPGGPQGRILVFDSMDPAVRRRMVTYDSRRGIINFAIHRTHSPSQPWPPTNAASDPRAFSAEVEDGSDPGFRPFTAQLRRDLASRSDLLLGGVGGSLPTAFGSARNVFGPLVRVVPGSDVVQRVLASGAVGEPLRRVGWAGIGPALDRYVAQVELGPDEYTIDYTTGEIALSERDPSLLFLRPGNPEQLWVRYQFQTNASVDTVRVSYTTQELFTIQMGVVQYSTRTGEGLPVQSAQQVRIRNMTR